MGQSEGWTVWVEKGLTPDHPDEISFGPPDSDTVATVTPDTAARLAVDLLAAAVGMLTRTQASAAAAELHTLAERARVCACPNCGAGQRGVSG